MSKRTPFVIGLVVVMLVGSTGLAAAHSWQTEVEQGDIALGVSSAPEEPVAGMQTEFSGSITDTAAEEGQENRTDYGGVTNKELEVHINGPGEIHDHVTVEVPEDDSHFQFAYVFPEAGTYTLTAETTIDGQEYALEFERNVTLLPARAEGENIDHLGEEVHGLQEQINELNEQNASQNEHAESENESSPSMAGLGLAAVVGVVGALGGVLIGRRS